MTKRPPGKRYKSAKEKIMPLRTLQAMILANAPDGVLKNPLSFMSEKPRAERKPSEKPRGDAQQGETPFTYDLIAELRKLWHTARCALYRNNNMVLRNDYGQPVRGGLGTGSPDAVGYKSITITQDMVNKKIAVFLGSETKTNSDKTDDWNQWFWLKCLHEAGGIALLINAARGLPHALNQIETWRPGQPFTLPEPPKPFNDRTDF